MKPLSSNSVEAQGPSHENGGIDLPAFNAEIEGKETIAGDYVFSHRLGFAQQHKPIARAKGKIEGKAPTQERINSLNRLQMAEEKLKQKQELVKQILHGNQI